MSNVMIQDKVPGTKIKRQTDTMPVVRPNGQRQTFGGLKLFYGSATEELGKEIAAYLNQEPEYQNLRPGKYQKAVFSNENILIRLEESVRGQDVYLVQTLCSPVHDNLMEMLIMIDTLKRDSAWRINLVVPYLSYARSDKKDQPRVGIAARLVANMIEVAGADRYITLDLHAGQIQGFFNIPGDALTAFYLLSDYVKKKNIPDLVVVAADLGFAKQGRNWAAELGTPMAIVEKRRVDNAERPEALSIIGDVRDRNVLLVDDEVLTGGSVVNAVAALRNEGARDIYLAFTHGLLGGDACKRLGAINLKEIILTNTIPVPPHKRLPNMTVLSVAPLLAEVIMRAHEGRSVGELFDE